MPRVGNDMDQRNTRQATRMTLPQSVLYPSAFPATPDDSEIDTTGNRPGTADTLSTSFFEDARTPSGRPFYNRTSDTARSPHLGMVNQALDFSTSVATPPVAEADLEQYEDLADSITDREPPITLSLNSAAIQNASLPSPRLSPTFAALQLQASQISDEDDGYNIDGNDMSPDTTFEYSQESINNSLDTSSGITRPRLPLPKQRGTDSAMTKQLRAPTVMDTKSMLENFDAMPSDMKTFMMFQFLRRCPRRTLHLVANVVNPALKCDFLVQLPPELGLHVLQYLTHRDLCRAAQVSHRWRDIVDTNETGWRDLFEKDKFVLPEGELDRAITEGWGWQNPHGNDGWEQDISAADKALEKDIMHTLYQDSVQWKELSADPRVLSKRKRTAVGSNSDRLKRRAVSVGGREVSQAVEVSRSALISRGASMLRGHKAEGPNSAANAAALAVKNPSIGLPSLRKLHLYKSLYRRHYMLQKAWTSGNVQPHHLAFAAHPRHVITCLQFDDDKIMTGSDDTFINIYDTKTGSLRKQLEGHEGGVWALQYEGNVLVSGSTDRSVRVWDIEKGLCTQVFHGHTSTVRCLQILMPTNTGKFVGGRPVMVPDKPLIITGSRDSQLRVWKLPEPGAKRYIQTGPPANDGDCPYFVRVLAGHQHSVRAIAAHEDTLVSGSYDCTVRVWKISTGETLHRLTGHAQKVYSVVLDHTRRRCISGSMDNFVKIWSLETGTCLYTLEGHSSLVGLLDLRDDRLVSAAADSTLRIWDPENGQCKHTLTAHTGAITCFQHDGRKVISGSDRTLKMWNVKTGECVQDLLTDLSGVWQVKFDDRRCVAAVQRDNLTFIEVSYDFNTVRAIRIGD